jgi:hypothetical protein
MRVGEHAEPLSDDRFQFFSAFDHGRAESLVVERREEIVPLGAEAKLATRRRQLLELPRGQPSDAAGEPAGAAPPRRCALSCRETLDQLRRLMNRVRRAVNSRREVKLLQRSELQEQRVPPINDCLLPPDALRSVDRRSGYEERRGNAGAKQRRHDDIDVRTQIVVKSESDGKSLSGASLGSRLKKP